MDNGLATDVPGSEEFVFPRPVYRVIADDDRASGNAPPMDGVRRQLDRLYDQFCAMYSRGRGAQFIVMAEIRRP